MPVPTRRFAYSSLLVATALVGVAACGGSSSSSSDDSDNDEPAAEASLDYAPSEGALPTASNFAFTGSEDGTLQGTGQADLDALDGFSTLAPLSIGASAPIAADSVVAGDSMRVFEVTSAQDPRAAGGPQPVTGIERELSADEDYLAAPLAADQNNQALEITPAAPLAPDTTYMVVVTDGVQGQADEPFVASQEYALLRSSEPLVDAEGGSQVAGLGDEEAGQLEPLRQLVDSQLEQVEGAGIARESVIASWTFTTQTVGAVLDEVAELVQAAEIAAGGLESLGPTPGELADVRVGVLENLPYYLTLPAEATDSAPREIAWEATGEVAGARHLTAANPQPAERGRVDVPVIVTVPQAGCDPACPVVVFQHGIRGNRTQVLALADMLASLPQPHVAVAIDLPLHGVSVPEDPFYVEGLERTFDLDLIDTQTGQPGSDGVIDPSGEHFINLQALRVSRDNLRQSVADLLALVDGGIDALDDALAEELATEEVAFIGQSLGGMVAVPLLARSGERIGPAVLAASGGGIAKLLDGSAIFGPSIELGLNLEGLAKGTPEYERFLGAAQAVADAADPLNHAAAAAANSPVLMLQVVGGNASPPDQVIPENLLEPLPQGTPEGTIPSPLAGSDPLANALGLTVLGPGVASAEGDDVVLRFTAGGHGSLLSPEADEEVSQRMQEIVAGFLLTSTVEVPADAPVEGPEGP